MKTEAGKSYPEYLTTGVIAKYCGVSKVTVLRWIKQGALTAFKIPGGHNRIRRADFNVFAAKHNIPIQKNTPKEISKREVAHISNQIINVH